MVTSTTLQHCESSCVAGMKHIALWIQNRVRSNSAPPLPLSGSNTPDSRTGSKLTSAITPENVPQFVIPSRQRKVAMVRTRSDGQVHDTCTDYNNNNMNIYNIVSGTQNKKPFTKVSSLPSQMYRMASDADSDCGASESEFPYLQTKTSSYGFTFVSEAPHTHRKESLFMGTDSMEMLQEFQKKYRSLSTDSPSSSIRKAPVERRAASIPISRSRKDGSCYSRSFPTSNKPRSFLRRQSSLNTLSSHCSDSDASLSADSCSPDSTQLQDTSVLGKLQCTLFYHKSRQQLEVKVIRAQQLMTKDTECNSYVKVYLESGKAVKQQTDIVRSDRNPTYDSVLTFKNVSRSDLKKKVLRLRVCNKIGSGVSLYSKRSSIGEVVLPLRQLGLEYSQEYNVCQDLDYITESQRVGCVYSTVELNTQEDQLYVTITEAANLRPMSPPDSYVTVCVTQKGRTTIQKQTQVKRNSSQPTFNEVFAFSLATTMDKLQSTSISIKVMSKERLRNDVAIGEVLLGGATSADRRTFWSNILNVPENKSSQWSEIS